MKRVMKPEGEDRKARGLPRRVIWSGTAVLIVAGLVAVSIFSALAETSQPSPRASTG